MLHVRILVPPDLTSAILAALDGSVGVANVCVARGVGHGPLGGDVIELDAAREVVDGLLDDLDRFDIERVGSIAIEQIDCRCPRPRRTRRPRRPATPPTRPFAR